MLGGFFWKEPGLGFGQGFGIDVGGQDAGLYPRVALCKIGQDRSQAVSLFTGGTAGTPEK